MLINLFRWLFGYVKFNYTGGFREDFINDCFDAGISLKNICLKGDVLTAQTGIKVYKRLHKIAFSHGGRVHIYKRKGFPFLFSVLNNRWGFFLGIVYLIFFISFMGSFVWNITVTGNDRVTDVKIVDYLAKNGFEIGTRWADTDKEQLEISILSEFEDVAWISINKFGSTAGIEINETVSKPEMKDNNITNVKASADGIVERVEVLGGWAEVQEGDAVAAGDLLISGIRESEVDEENHYAHAYGSVYARINREIAININRNQDERVTAYSREYKYLSIFGMEIPLFLKKESGNAVEETQKKYLVINDYRLPLGIITEKDDYFEIKTNPLSDDALEALARAELEKKKNQDLAACEILSEEVDVSVNENGCTITGKYTCIQDIAQETEILFDETDEDEYDENEDK